MPLPAALAARLAKRGLISGSEKHGMFNPKNIFGQLLFLKIIILKRCAFIFYLTTLLYTFYNVKTINLAESGKKEAKKKIHEEVIAEDYDNTKEEINQIDLSQKFMVRLIITD